NGPDRRHRPGGAGPARRAGRPRTADLFAATDRKLPPRDGRAARVAADPQGLPTDAQGVPAVPVEAAPDDLRAAPGVALRPAPGADHRRGGGRVATDQAV